MNNDKQKLDLEGLLAEVEHAGRDARRRDELAAMVDSMAGANRHGFWWWTVRVAAAACVLFFIGTAVRIWFIPTDSAVDDNLVAQAEVPETYSSPLATLGSPSPNLGEEQDSKAVVEEYDTETPIPTVREEIIEMPVVEEEYIAEKLPADTVAYSSPLAELGAPSPNLGEDPDSIAEPIEPVEAIAAPIVSVDNTHATPTEENKPKRASIFKNLFRRQEPSKMDGTMLALNIL
jgi:hypothetical protein